MRVSWHLSLPASLTVAIKVAIVLVIASSVSMSCTSKMLSHSSLAGVRWPDAPGPTTDQALQRCAAADIRDTEIRALVDPVFRGRASSYRLAGVDGGPFFEVAPGIEMEHEKKLYSLRMMRLRSPSEHRVVGAAFLLELQLFFVSADAEPVMVSVLARKGESSSFLVRLLKDSTGKVNAGEWVPRYGGHYAYVGALPGSSPCRSARHLVMRSAIEISADDLETYLTRWGAAPTIPALPVKGVQESE